MAEVSFTIAEKMRADLVAYAAPNLTGKRSAVRIFPSGRQGGMLAEDVRSLVVRAPHGTRVILCTRAGEAWEDWPWRAVRVLPGSCLPPKRPGGLPGVVVPDLDLLDDFGAKRTSPGLQSSYPLVDRLADGTGWTFGRAGLPSLKGHIREIRVEPDEAPAAQAGSPEERLGRGILEAAADQLDPAALEVLREIVADQVCEALRAGGANARRIAAVRGRLAG